LQERAEHQVEPDLLAPHALGAGKGGSAIRQISRSRLNSEAETERAALGRAICSSAQAFYCTSTARVSAIFCCQIVVPVMCTDSPLVSTATVTGMSFTSNS